MNFENKKLFSKNAFLGEKFFISQRAFDHCAKVFDFLCFEAFKTNFNGRNTFVHFLKEMFKSKVAPKIARKFEIKISSAKWALVVQCCNLSCERLLFEQTEHRV